MYITAAVKTSDNIIKNIAVHFQEHLEVKLF